MFFGIFLALLPLRGGWLFAFAREGKGGVSAPVVGSSVGLLLLTLARVLLELNFLSLLATVRGGTSFLCPWD